MKLGTVMLYIKKIQKIYKSCDTPHEFCWHQYLLTRIHQLCYVKKYRYRLHFNTWFVILLTFFQSLKVSLRNRLPILIISAKLATLGLFKIKVIWKKGFDVTFSVHEVTNEILSRDSNYIIDVVMWPTSGISSISMKEFIITSIL